MESLNGHALLMWATVYAVAFVVAGNLAGVWHIGWAWTWLGLAPFGVTAGRYLWAGVGEVYMKRKRRGYGSW